MSQSVLKKIDEHVRSDVQPQINNQPQMKRRSSIFEEVKSKDINRKLSKKPSLYKTIQLQKYINPQTVAQQSCI